MKVASLLVILPTFLVSCRPAPHELRADIVVPSRGGLPTFRIEYKNDTDHAIERLNPINTVRVDGNVVPLNIVGSIMGGPPPMAPGSTWTEMIAPAPTEYHGFDVGIPLFTSHSRAVYTWSPFAAPIGDRETSAFSWEPPS